MTDTAMLKHESEGHTITKMQELSFGRKEKEQKRENQQKNINRRENTTGNQAPSAILTFMTELMDGFYTYDSTHPPTHTCKTRNKTF
jgi:hypothetical protein